MATQPAFTRRPADDSFKQLVVTQGTAPNQFNVENGDGSAGDDFDAEYVAFGSYFGPHGPYVFAAAPALADALRKILAHEDDLSASSAGQAVIAHARAALAKIGTPA